MLKLQVRWVMHAYDGKGPAVWQELQALVRMIR